MIQLADKAREDLIRDVTERRSRASGGGEARDEHRRLTHERVNQNLRAYELVLLDQEIDSLAVARRRLVRALHAAIACATFTLNLVAGERRDLNRENGNPKAARSPHLLRRTGSRRTPRGAAPLT